MCADTGSEQTSVVLWESGGTSVKCSGCSWSLCRAPGCAYLLLCAQPSVKSPRRPEWPQIPPFAASSNDAPPPFLTSTHLSIHPSSALALASPGPGLCAEGVRRAGRQAGRPASCRDQLWPGALISPGLFVEGQESSESCGGGRQSW